MNRWSVHLPVEVPAPRCPSAPYKNASRRMRGDGPPDPIVYAKRPIRMRTMLICLVLSAGLCVALILALWALGNTAGGTESPDGWGDSFSQGLLQGGLPPTGGVGAETTDETTAEITPADTVTETQSPTVETDGFKEPVEPAETAEATDPPDAEETLPREPETVGAEEPVTNPAELETETEPAEESDTQPDGKEEPAPPVPEGCYSVISADMSRADCGAGYTVCDEGAVSGALPSVGLPAERLWSTDAPPTVLIVNTHPYEGYSNGADWYDPAEGGLAQTETPNAAEGTVALGASLARALRGMGVTVIHLRIAVSAEDSAANIYDRTETVVRSYCRLYPDIGLILDLRRSAELTADGGILRTAGSLNRESCAQLRISVSGGRAPSALGEDLAVALTLRSGLWDLAPTISRPVRVKRGEGLVGDLTGVRVLTLEMGSAGNTYAEAERLSTPVAAVLSGMILDIG